MAKSSNPAVIELEEKLSVAISSITEAKKNIAVNKQLITNILEKNPEYERCVLQIEALQKDKKEIKRTLMKANKDLATLHFKNRDINGIKKEYQISISDYLEQYEKLTGEKRFKGQAIVTTKKLA